MSSIAICIVLLPLRLVTIPKVDTVPTVVPGLAHVGEFVRIYGECGTC
jgi:hypothetical protein